MKRFLIALQFLTILPVRVKPPVADKDLGGSLLFFPLVGFVIGLVLSSIVLIPAPLPVFVRAALILSASIIITGGIHLDGLADTCDGFYGNNPRDRILEIMRDSRVGTMGVAGIVSILLLKFSFMAGLAEGSLWKALILMSTFSRWTQVMACFLASYARSDGKAGGFIEHAGRKEFFTGLVFTLAIFYLFLQIDGLVLFFASALPFFFFLKYINKRIGGVTGDTIGALNELAEVSVLLFVLFLE